jgi:hypothetical protein
VGGRPILAAGQGWPACRQCGARQVLFFQVDFDGKVPEGTRAGEHLLAFMCPKHNDIPMLLKGAKLGDSLPDRHWERHAGHYDLILNPPGTEEKAWEREPHLVHQGMKFVEHEDPREKDGNLVVVDAFKLGGRPRWLQDEELYRCFCGADLQFLVMVPENYGFVKEESAPEQPDGFSEEHYGLFLGNQTYIFACENRCNPRSVWPIVQK